MWARDRIFILGIYKENDLARAMRDKTLQRFARDDSTIALTAKRVTNKLNTKSEVPTHHPIS